MKLTSLSILSLLLLLLSFTVSAQEIKGKLGYVIDGDSFYMVQDGGRRLRVRVSGIDSPENDQAFGKASTEYLKALLSEKEIIVTPDGADRQGRMVGKNIGRWQRCCRGHDPERILLAL